MFQVNVNVTPGFATELALTVALPVLSFLHNTLVISSTDITASQSCTQLITTLCVETQPLASVTVTVYCVPPTGSPERPVAVAVVCAAGSSHK